MTILAQIAIFAVWSVLLFFYFATIFSRTLQNWDELEGWTDVAVWSGLIVFQLGFVGLLSYLVIGLGPHGVAF